MSYPAGATITMPAGTSIEFNSVGFTDVEMNGVIINYPSGSTTTYANETMVTFLNGAVVTFTDGTVQTLDPVECGIWSGVGIADLATGLFEPTEALLGINTVTFTVKKGDCIVEASIDIIVEDTEAPIFDFCPADMTVETPSCLAFVTIDEPTYSDNCGVMSVSHTAIHSDGTIVSDLDELNASGIYPAGETTVTWTITDYAGNTETCVTIITVIDTENPYIICGADIMTTVDDGICGAMIDNIEMPVAFDLVPIGVDDCGDVEVTFVATHLFDEGGEAVNQTIIPDATNPDASDANGLYPAGTTEIIYTATDAYGNVATCNVIVTVIDDIAPEFVACPSDITVTTVPPNAGTDPITYYCNSVAFWTPPTIIDNCSTPIDQAAVDAYLDAQQNLQDAQAGLISASANLMEAQAALEIAETALAVFPTDPDLLAAYDLALMDVNAAQTVFDLLEFAEDNAQALFDTAEANLLAAQAATDITVTSTHNSGDIFEVGTTTVTYTAIDNAGNITTCSFEVTVVDDELPTFVCPEDVTIVTNSEECEKSVVVGQPTLLNDNCGIDSYYNSYNGTQNASGVYPVGETIVTWFVTDVNGNVNTCDMTITIVDDTAPTILECPAGEFIAPYENAIAANNLLGECNGDVIVPQPIVDDNCGIESIVNDYNGTDNATDNYPVGLTEVIWTVTDVNGNETTCMTQILVIDNEAPTITCPDDITVTTDPVICAASITTALVTVPQPIVGENCNIATITNSFNGTDDASGEYPLGTTIVLWSAIDEAGNTVSCSMMVTVLPCCEANAGTPSVIPQECPGTPVVATTCDTDLFLALQEAEEDLLFVQTLLAQAGADLLQAANDAGYAGTDLVDLQAELGNPNNQALIDAVNAEYQSFVLANIALTAAELAYDNALAAYEASCTHNTSAEYELYFIILDENGVIVAIDDDGIIQTLGSGLPAGLYYAYSYSVKTGDEPNIAPYIGGMLAEIGLNDEGCHEVSPNGVPFTVATGTPGLVTGPNTFEGDNGGVSPLYYNVNQIEILGGTPPYEYVWDVTGYVRYSIIEIDGVAYINIIYADNATWSVTVSDYDDCDVNYAVYSNDPDGAGSAGSILDIYDSAVVPQSDSSNPNGAIDIFIEGGTPCAGGGYNYEWYYQDGTYMGDTEDLTDLQTGWYTVFVTDCGVGEDQQNTIGWYWVEPSRRGRNKTSVGEANLVAYPNPFSETTTIEFSLVEDGMTNVSIYAIDGQKVAEVFDGMAKASETYQVSFEAANLPSGIYFIDLTNENGEVKQQKLILTK